MPDQNRIIMNAIKLMKPKIQKSLQQTHFQERKDLEQEIYLKIIIAIKSKRIRPISFTEFREEYKKRNQVD